jgi:hypothetical protein
MTIREIVTEGLYYARTCKSLWLFGFFVGLASGGSNGAGRGGNGGGARFPDFSPAQIAVTAGIVFLVIAVLLFMRFLGEGALIEGVLRARHGGTMTMREGFRAGWAHWGVLVRIGLLYFAVTVISVALLAAPCVLAVQAFGPVGAVLPGLAALFVGVPWLVTLHVVQAFASRIAVIENRHAFDAIRKARLFLHGRLTHGLKLIVAAFAGSLALVLIAAVVIWPVALVLAGLIPVLRVVPVLIVACLLVVPPVCVLGAMVGTFRSSVWTIGYLTQVES